MNINMPTRNNYRTWCKKCQDWTWHQIPFKLDVEDAKKTDWQCKICDTPISDITLKEIPREKVLEQRERYKEYKKRGFNEMMGLFMSIGYGGFGISNKDSYIENDAGQKLIDEERIRQKELERTKRLQEEKNYQEKFYSCCL
jgi:hypothetical protein